MGFTRRFGDGRRLPDRAAGVGADGNGASKAATAARTRHRNHQGFVGIPGMRVGAVRGVLSRGTIANSSRLVFPKITMS